MMKQILVTILLLHVVMARPQLNKDSVISSYENFNDKTTNYHFAYQTTNGITQEQSGQFVPTTNGATSVTVEGSYSFTAPDGTTQEVRYTADENGYRPYVSIRSPVSTSFQTPNWEKGNANKFPYFTATTESYTVQQRDKQNEYDSNELTDEPIRYCNVTSTDENPNATQNSLSQNDYNSTNTTCIDFDDRISKKAQMTILGAGG